MKLEDLPKLVNISPKTGHYSEVVTDIEYEKGLAIEGIIHGVANASRTGKLNSYLPMEESPPKKPPISYSLMILKMTTNPSGIGKIE